MAYPRQNNQFCLGDTPGKIFGVFPFDEFILFALHDRNGHADFTQVPRRVIRLSPHHQADRVDKPVEVVGRAGQFGIIPRVTGETPVDDWIRHERLRPARIHVASEEKYACHPFGSGLSEDQGDARAVALGVDLSRTRWLTLIASSLLVAAAVSVSGVIGFVGLIVPHLVRAICGSDTRWTVPASIPAGAAIVVLADTLARSAVPPLRTCPNARISTP